MTLRELATELSAKVLCGEEDLDTEVQTAAASDLMSDILARLGTPDVMLTGLTTGQAIRTSSVSGIRVVVVVRGKRIPEQMIELAAEEGIVLMSSEMTLFEASGRLYARGLRSNAEGER